MEKLKAEQLALYLNKPTTFGRSCYSIGGPCGHGTIKAAYLRQDPDLVPILRRLTDLTEAENEKFIELGGRSFHYRNDGNHEVVGTVESIDYLRNRGIDIYGWIEDGKAEDYRRWKGHELYDVECT